MKNAFHFHLTNGQHYTSFILSPTHSMQSIDETSIILVIEVSFWLLYFYCRKTFSGNSLRLFMHRFNANQLCIDNSLLSIRAHRNCGCSRFLWNYNGRFWLWNGSLGCRYMGCSRFANHRKGKRNEKARNDQNWKKLKMNEMSIIDFMSFEIESVIGRFILWFRFCLCGQKYRRSHDRNAYRFANDETLWRRWTNYNFAHLNLIELIPLHLLFFMFFISFRVIRASIE